MLFGSETGTAEDVAWSIAEEMGSRGMGHPRCLAMDDYPIENLPNERLVVCVAATAGDGAAPSNMRRSWQALLRADLPRDALSGVDYAVFGLGDSGYAKFNAAARRLDTRLSQLGATRLLPAGMGDDQDPQGEDTALSSWMAGMWEALSSRMHSSGCGAKDDDDNDDVWNVHIENGGRRRSTLMSREGGGGGEMRAAMSGEEAETVVASVCAMSRTVLFSLGSPVPGMAACALSISLAKKLRCRAYGFFDCLRSPRVSLALEIIGDKAPSVFIDGKRVTGEEWAGEEAGEQWGRKGCLNEEWGGVGGEAHKYALEPYPPMPSHGTSTPTPNPPTLHPSLQTPQR